MAVVGCPARAADSFGAFVQLNRAHARRPAADWQAAAARMRAMGVDTVVVQWCAEGDTAYLRTGIPYAEEYDTVASILDAAAAHDLVVYLGLHNDPNFWRHITARPAVVRDYFLVRVAQNERLQQELLRRFDKRGAWRGYYIPDEIDDLNWRDAQRRDLFRGYLTLMTRRLRTNDPRRRVGVSAFFRGRSEPAVFAANLARMLQGAGLDHLLIQDGRGEDDPPKAYTGLYLQALAKAWDLPETELWGIVEVFERTSAPGEPFSAVPAAPERVTAQIREAGTLFRRLVFFSFMAYMDPAAGERQRVLYDALARAAAGGTAAGLRPAAQGQGEGMK
ncbi:MAG: DUF4434 domain-containing protein [Kiritimatiellae bacterium]|nr:DUF4434 domain-containing protein [Kiritimatiellia bacterium]